MDCAGSYGCWFVGLVFTGVSRMKGLVLKVVALTGVVLLTACGHTPAPVEDRSGARAPERNVKDLENGIYRVRRDETLYSIAFSHGLDWKDVAGWNNIRSPYTIYVGQELRLKPPAVQRTTGTRGIAPRTTARTTPRSTTRTANIPEPSSSSPQPAQRPVQPPKPATTPTQTTPEPVTQSTPASTTPPPAERSAPAADPNSWLWPTNGRVISRYSANDPARKGINIAGNEGQDIVASAAGDVVYSGNGLIGFGELIIIKHSDRMLTAYAHNRTRLVNEGDRVAAGSKIAEMGRNDQEQVMLHFELRVVGKPVDPLQYLPRR